MYYEKVFLIFQKMKIKYLVAGGLAVNLHGVPRFTQDIDILIDSDFKNLSLLRKALQKLGYKPKIPVSIDDFLNPVNWLKWKKEKGAVAVTAYNPKKPYEEIDLLVNTEMSYREARAKAVTIKSGGLQIRLIGIDELIRMKKKSGREQDLSDVRALQKIKRMK